jgi:hypothetical protein
MQTHPNANDWADLHTLRLLLYALGRCAHLAGERSLFLRELFPSLGLVRAGAAEVALVPFLLPLLRSERQLNSSSIAALLQDGVERAIINADGSSFADSLILLKLLSCPAELCHQLPSWGSTTVPGTPRHRNWLALLVQRKLHPSGAEQSKAVHKLRDEYSKCSRVADICPFLLVVLSDAEPSQPFVAPNLLFLGQNQLAAVYGSLLLRARREGYLSPLQPTGRSLTLEHRSDNTSPSTPPAAADPPEPKAPTSLAESSGDHPRRPRPGSC